MDYIKRLSLWKIKIRSDEAVCNDCVRARGAQRAYTKK